MVVHSKEFTLDINVLNILLFIALLSTILSCVISIYLIINHQIIMKDHAASNQIAIFRIQSKIVGIIWMIPIYSINSFLGLICPIYITIYLDMLRDCYEAYVLYLFLSLLFSYLCYNRGDEYALAMYFERKHCHSQQTSYFWNEKETGRSFLRNCKFGTLQYCVIRPLSTLVAIILDHFGLYHESEFNMRYGYVYIIAIMNCSVGYSFMALASFYSVFKYKLKPFHPIGWIRDNSFKLDSTNNNSNNNNLSAKEIAIKLQDLLICIEMVFASIAFLYAFSHRPYMEDSFQQSLYSFDINSIELLPDEDVDDNESANYRNKEECNNMYIFEKDSTKKLLVNQIHEHRLYKCNQAASIHDDIDYDLTDPPTNVLFANAHSKFKGNNVVSSNCELSDHYITSPYNSSSDNLTSNKLKYILTTQAPQVHDTTTDNTAITMISDSKVSAHGLSAIQNINKTAAQKLIPSSYSSTTTNTTDILKTPVISKKQHQQQQKWLRNNQKTSIKYQQLASHVSRDHSSPFVSTTTTRNNSNNYNIDSSNSISGVLDKHFSFSSALRDFNETMPVVVLPSGFEMTKGVVIHSDPTSRLS